MAFRQHHRPQPSRQLSFQLLDPPTDVGATSSPQRKRTLEQSEEWVLFSPAAPSTTARTHTTSTERTPRTAGLSRLSDFGSLDTAARSDQNDDDITCQGTEDGEELDSLDDGLHAFHEPSEHGAPVSRLQQSGDTVLPTHDGLGTFQPDADMQDHLWQFERQPSRRRHVRRRSSVQRRLDALEEVEEANQEHDRRQRIEKWRLEQSRALLEEIERETRRRRRMSMVSAARSRADSAHHEEQRSSSARIAPSVSDEQSVSSDESTEHLSFWQRLTRRVIRDLMGIDEDTLSVIFGEALPEEASQDSRSISDSTPPADLTPQTLEVESFSGEPWEHRLLERVARELGIIVHQLSGHPGAFSTYRKTQETPDYAGLSATTNVLANSDPSSLNTSQPTSSSPTHAHFRPTVPTQHSTNAYSEASLWGIEEEDPDVDPLDSFRTPPVAKTNTAEELVREQEYWERELDVKMVFNFLVQRFSSRRSSASSHRSRSAGPSQAGKEAVSARRAAIIRQHHPLVNRNTDRVPTASSGRDSRRRDTLYKQHFNPQTSLRSQVLRSSSSCASQSTKKSRKSAGSGHAGRNYWDMSGSVGSGSVIAGEA